MKILPKFLVMMAAASALLLLTGCPKKPVRAENPPLGGPDTTTPVTPEDIFAPGEEQLQVRDLEATADDGSGPGIRVPELQSVYFAFDRYAIEPGERAKLDAAANWLKQNSDKRIVLEGHCDWRGTTEYNLGLGDSRANAVRKYLEYLGVDGKRLETTSKGDIDAKEGASPDVMAKDRRVDFYVIRSP